MKSYTITALGIAFKIWIFAVLINSIADTFLFGDFDRESMGIFLLIVFFAALFSLPIFLILWAIIYNLLHAGRSESFILKFLLLTGVGLAIATWLVFAAAFHFWDDNVLGLAIAAPVSGALSIYISYPNIKKACYTRDEGKNLIESIGTDQPVTQT